MAYPQFGSVGLQQAQEFFNRACTLISNLPNSPVPYLPMAQPPVYTRKLILNAATAHFAYIFTPDASGNVRPVGRINQATEGSVSAGLDYAAAATDTQAFWNQSPFGAYVWVALLPYRSALYMPGRTPQPGQGLGYYAGRR
jgi:hypothetical protein